MQIALAGNPNTGKSTLFNRLTGVRQRVGNYPGVTVEKKTGTMRLAHSSATVIDLPGAYSLAAASADERVVIDVLTGHIEGTSPPDLVVCVVDATNLMRNLFLATQIADIGIPIVIALNMFDAAQDQGIEIDTKLLSQRLGVPVVCTVAAKGRGVRRLRAAIEEALGEQSQLVKVSWPDAVHEALLYLGAAVERSTGRSATEAEMQRLLFDLESAVADRLGWTADDRDDHVAEARAILKRGKLNAFSAEAMLRYSHLSELLDGVVTGPAVRGHTTSESVDNVLTHRFWGLFILAGLMWLVFQSIYTWAGPMMRAIEAVFGALGQWVGGMLEGTPTLQSLVVDGMIAGVGGVVVFLPQILILFFFVALLEDTGYMARAAFLMDKLFSWCGLNGKCFVPLLSSYACAIPGVMGSRTIEDPKARLVTILICPLMSCSARLPVYVLLIGAFIEPVWGAGWAGFALFVMHFVGLAVAIPIALVLSRVVLRIKPTPFVLEMPPYRVPALRDVLWRMWDRGKHFLVRAGTVIFAMTIVIWALCYFPRPGEVEEAATAQYVQQVAAERGLAEAQVTEAIEAGADERLLAGLDNAVSGAYIEQSMMGRMGKTVQPIFAPAGFDWKITVSVLASFPAREVIIATLGIIYNLGGDVDEESGALRATMRSARWPDGSPVYTPLVAVVIMVFFALCMQCASTLAIIAKETNWGWAAFCFCYMTVLAWVGAVTVYQVGSLIVGSA